MIEVKFSLELTKNGVQKCIHAKSGEENSRKAVITLTENGKVFDAAGYYVKVYFDNGKHVDTEDDRKLVTVENGCIGFVIPYDLVAEEGERLCELQISKDNRILYSPVFKVLVEQSLGQHGVSEPAGDVTRYQEVIPDLAAKEGIAFDDEIAVYTPEDELTTKRKVSDLPFGVNSINVALQTFAAMLATEGIFASVEAPGTASSSEKFAALISTVYSDNSIYYAPSNSGTLVFADPFSGKDKTVDVIKGDVYSFEYDYVDGDIKVRKMNSLEDVDKLEKLAHSDFATKNEIPTKLSQLKNDKSFISESKVQTMINDSADAVLSETEEKIAEAVSKVDFVDESEAETLINNALNAAGVAKHLRYIVVGELPETDIDSSTIYLVPSTGNAIKSSLDNLEENVYNGKGYAENTTYMPAFGEDGTKDGVYITGYMPVTTGDAINLNGITFNKNNSDCKIMLFQDPFNIPVVPSASELTVDYDAKWDGDGNLVSFKNIANTSYKYLRVQASYIGNSSSVIVKGQDDNFYNEFIYVSGEWEQLGGKTKIPEDVLYQIRQNSLARHTHANKAVLDKFILDGNGDLLFDGKPFGSPETQMLEVVVDFADGYIGADENSKIMTVETSRLPVNARVVKVEIPDVVNQTDEYIQLEDMAAKDSMGIAAPYFIMYPKNTQGSFFTIVAAICFTMNVNSFFNAAISFLYSDRTIKIYYEIEG